MLNSSRFGGHRIRGRVNPYRYHNNHEEEQNSGKLEFSIAPIAHVITLVGLAKKLGQLGSFSFTVSSTIPTNVSLLKVMHRYSICCENGKEDYGAERT